MNVKFIDAVVWMATSTPYSGIRLTETNRLTCKPTYGEIHKLMLHYDDRSLDTGYEVDKVRNARYDQLISGKGVKAEIKARLLALK